MWVILILLLLFTLIISWFLWGRIALCIDTYKGRYYLSFGGLLSMAPVERDGQIFMAVKVPFYRFYLDPTETINSTRKQDQSEQSIRQKDQKARGRTLGVKFYLQLALEALKTFTVKTVKMDIDTGDFAFNAKLIPVMIALSRGPAELNINYMGRNHLWIEIENQLVRFIPLIFRLLQKKYF
jgi:hypothetical protein